jgi:Ca2+-transporting ATPase
VYEAEKTDAQIMQRPPRDPHEPLFNLGMLAVSLALGGTMLLAVLAVYAWALRGGYTEGETRAAAFAAIVAANVALIFVTRSRRRSAAAMLLEPNRALWWISAGALGALLAAINVAPFAAVFRFEPIGPGELAISALAGIAGVAWYELWKLLPPSGRA